MFLAELKNVLPLLLIGALPFLFSGCEGVYGTVPGEHWFVTITDSDPKLEPDTSAKLGHLIAERLHFAVLNIVPETKGWQSSFADMSASSQTRNLSVVVLVDRSQSRVDLEVRYFGDSADAGNIQRDVAEQALAILKEVYPHATAKPYIRYRGLLGP